MLPQIPGEEVFGSPKSLLRRCLGGQIPAHHVFGCLGFGAYVKDFDFILSLWKHFIRVPKN